MCGGWIVRSLCGVKTGCLRRQPWACVGDECLCAAVVQDCKPDVAWW